MFAQKLSKHVRATLPDCQRRAARGRDNVQAVLLSPGTSQQGFSEAWKQEEAAIELRSRGKTTHKPTLWEVQSFVVQNGGHSVQKGLGVQSMAGPGQKSPPLP